MMKCNFQRGTQSSRETLGSKEKKDFTLLVYSVWKQFSNFSGKDSFQGLKIFSQQLILSLKLPRNELSFYECKICRIPSTPIQFDWISWFTFRRKLTSLGLVLMWYMGDVISDTNKVPWRTWASFFSCIKCFSGIKQFAEVKLMRFLQYEGCSIVTG